MGSEYLVGVISGSAAFRLHTECGFPIDMIVVMAREEGVVVDVIGYDRLMAAHVERSKRRSVKIGGES